jgi:hypothetical protein
MTEQNLLDGNVEQIQEAVAEITDLDQVQALIDAENGEGGKHRKGVLSALERRADQLAAAPENADLRPATEPVDADGFYAQILQGDLPMIHDQVSKITREADLDQVERLEQAGRKRAGVFMVVAQRRKALEPQAKRKGKVKPPVWLDTDGNVHHLKGIRLVNDLRVYPDRGYASQVYDAELEGHTGRYKALLSLENGMPIGGTMGEYLRRIYADGE